MSYLSKNFTWIEFALIAALLLGGGTSLNAQDVNLESPWGPPLIRPLPDPNVVETLPEEIPAVSEEIPAVKTEDVLVGPVIEPPPKIWDFSLEFGLSGTDGNSESFNYRLGTHVKRTLPGTIFTLNLDYKRDTANGLQTANRAFLEGRQEWELADSLWNYYLHGTFEYDEFRAFDSRISLDTGLGYTFFDSDVASLKGRLGAGVSREIGGPDDSYVPEAVFGLAYEREISDRQRFNAGVDYFPSWEDYNDFRVNSRIGWEFVLDEASNLSLKIGATSRYDSTPNGARRNDIDYSTTLIWKY